MTRVKRGMISRRKHKKVLKKTKGYLALKSRSIRKAKEAVLHAGSYSFHGRKRKKRDMRSLWITRIGEAAKAEGLSYNVFINKLKKSNIELDRKIISEIVVSDPSTFKQIISSLK